MNYTVSYKYVKEMPVIQRDRSYFLKSIMEKYDKFINLKLQLFVSPFYPIGSNNFIWQPLFDFDGTDAFAEFRKFCNTFNISDKDWFIEYSGQGIHLVSKIGFYPVASKDISFMRDKFRELLKNFTSLDVTTSVRDLPIRRIPSLSSNGTFMLTPQTVSDGFKKKMKTYEIEPGLIKDWLIQYTLPSKLQHKQFILQSFRK